MIICFECQHDTKILLDELMRTGQYENYAELISSALANEAMLRRELLKKGVLFIGDGEDNKLEVKSDRIQPDKDSKISRGVSKRGASQATVRPTAKVSPLVRHSARASIQIPSAFLLGDLLGRHPELIGLTNDVWAINEDVPLERWIFGQYNKLLPAKASCRALAHLIIDKPKGLLISEAAPKIAEEAALLGDFLLSQDKRNSAVRDDYLSIAFPGTGEEGEKGRLRYASQFVASVNNNGQLSGLLVNLKLINAVKKAKGDAQILLTEPGWRFTSLHNPILDATQEGVTQRFSSEEISFLLDHIAHLVPAEDFAYRAIIAAIDEGANTPEKIDSALQRYVSSKSKSDLSESFLSSQRSGAISRMADLGLLARVREGVKVSYVLTEYGKQYAKRAR